MKLSLPVDRSPDGADRHAVDNIVERSCDTPLVYVRVLLGDGR